MTDVPCWLEILELSSAEAEEKETAADFLDAVCQSAILANRPPLAGSAECAHLL